MKRSRIIIFIVLILLLTLAVCSCRRSEEKQTEPIYYTVTFDSAGGSAVESVKVVEGGKISLPTEPNRDGYIFDGWKKNGGSEWDFENDTVKSDVTLKASWIDASTVFGYLTVEGSDGIVISSLKSEYSKTVCVPSIINGLRVIGINDSVFEGKSSETIKKIIVPEGIGYIGANAFKNCVGIEIVIEGALTKVGEAAFYGCDGLKSVSFGEGLTEISVEAFSGCTALTEVRFPSTLVKIGENAFEDCIALKFIVMHDAARLSNGAFIGCDSLVTVFFYGTEESFDSVFEDENGNGAVAEAKLYLYSAQEQSGCWYMDEKGKIKLWK